MEAPSSKVTSLPHVASPVVREAFDDYISARGLTPEQAIACRLLPADHSDPRAKTIHTVYEHFKPNPSAIIPGMLVDYGGGYYTFRYLHHDLPIDKGGKPIKLACPSNQPSRLFLPPIIDWADVPAGSKILLCESALKAVACAVRGEYALGLNGVWGWGGVGKPLPELLDLTYDRRWQFVVCLDSNAHEGSTYNPNVAQAQKELVRALYSHCGAASVELLRIPSYRNMDQGVDDYLAGGGDLADLERIKVGPDGHISAAPTSIDSFLAQAFPTPEPIVDNFIALGEANLLTAAPKTGKTRIALTIALQIAAGRGCMLGIPGMLTHKSKVLLVVLEDAGGHLQTAIKGFCDEMEITGADLAGDLQLIRAGDLQQGSDLLMHIDHMGFSPDLVILDNLTKLGTIEDRIEPGGTLVQREYAKVHRFAQWAQERNKAILIMSHSKKGAGSATNVADKTNSTGTQGASVDNLASLDKFPPKEQKGENLRRFTTNPRNYRSQDLVLHIGQGPVRYAGDLWEYQLTPAEEMIVDSLRNGPLSAKQVAKLLGKSESTIQTQGRTLVDKGWLEGVVGPGGGYRLSDRARQSLKLSGHTEGAEGNGWEKR